MRSTSRQPRPVRQALVAAWLLVAGAVIVGLPAPSSAATDALPAGPSCSFAWRAPAPVHLQQYRATGLVSVPFAIACTHLPRGVGAVHFDLSTPGGEVVASAGNAVRALPTTFSAVCSGRCLVPGSTYRGLPLFVAVGSIAEDYSPSDSTVGALVFQDEQRWWSCDHGGGCGSVVVGGVLEANPLMPSGGYVAVVSAASRSAGDGPYRWTAAATGSTALALYVVGAVVLVAIGVGFLLALRRRRRQA
jgi:hypothetical protein